MTNKERVIDWFYDKCLIRILIGLTIAWTIFLCWAAYKALIPLTKMLN